MKLCTTLCIPVLLLLTLHIPGHTSSEESADDKVKEGDSSSARYRRSPTTPCLTCTVLNHVPCCQRFNKCCDATVASLTNKLNRTQGQAVTQQTPPAPAATAATPATAPKPADNQNPENDPKHPANVDVEQNEKDQSIRTDTKDGSISNPCSPQSCKTPCSANSDCSSPNTTCCRLHISCCREIDSSGFCPSNSMDMKKCLSCSGVENCQAVEECCPQPSSQGCCLGSCAPCRQSGIRPSRRPTQNNRDDTIVEPIDQPVLAQKTEIISTTTTDELGNKIDITQTVFTDERDIKHTLFTFGLNGMAHTVQIKGTMTETVHINENDETVFEIPPKYNEEVIVYEIDGKQEQVTRKLHVEVAVSKMEDGLNRTITRTVELIEPATQTKSTVIEGVEYSYFETTTERIVAEVIVTTVNRKAMTLTRTMDDPRFEEMPAENEDEGQGEGGGGEKENPDDQHQQGGKEEENGEDEAQEDAAGQGEAQEDAAGQGEAQEDAEGQGEMEELNDDNGVKVIDIERAHLQPSFMSPSIEKPVRRHRSVSTTLIIKIAEPSVTKFQYLEGKIYNNLQQIQN